MGQNVTYLLVHLRDQTNIFPTEDQYNNNINIKIESLIGITFWKAKRLIHLEILLLESISD